MPVLNEGQFAGEFLVSEANGRISRDVITVAQSAALVAGTILGKITASGKYVIVAPAAADGSQNAAAVLYAYTDASGADAQAVIIARQAEVNAAEVVYPAGATNNQIAAINSQLAGFGILVRSAV